MRRLGHRGRVDGNHGLIVAAFLQHGFSVQSLAAVGEGCPDLLIAKWDRCYVVEVKRGKGKVNERQQKWHDSWNSKVLVVRSLDDVQAFVLNGNDVFR